MSRLSIANLADTLRISVFGGDVTVYFFVFRGLDYAALVKDGVMLAGAGLEAVENDFYLIETLWADTAVSAVSLLYATLEHYKRIVPSRHISPAAQAVVKNFYNKYKGTEVVEEGANNDPGATPELKAGYKWSSKLRKVPLKVGTPASQAEAKLLFEGISTGFQKAYNNPKRTKKEHPDNYWEKFELDNLQELLTTWLDAGGAQESNAIEWMVKHRHELETINNRQTRAILEMLDYSLDV